MSEKPIVPALDLETASSGGSETITRTKSLGNKIKGGLKRMMTPRSGSAASSTTSLSKKESLEDTAKTLQDDVTEQVTEAEEKVAETVDESSEAISHVAGSSRLGKEVESESKKDKKHQVPITGAVSGVAVVVALVLGLIISKSSKKKKPEEPVAEKKKGMW